MRSVLPMWIAKIVNMAMSACFFIFGIVVLTVPSIAESTIIGTTGILLILLGVFKLVGYFSKDLFRLAFQYDLQLGVILVLLGIVAVMGTDRAIEFICMIFGISIFVDGLFKISIALDAKKFGIRYWFVILTAAIATCVCGTVLSLIHPPKAKILIVDIGISLILEGILIFIVVSGTVKIIKNQRSDRLERYRP